MEMAAMTSEEQSRELMRKHSKTDREKGTELQTRYAVHKRMK
jgi:hypothetical protein